MEGSRMPWDKEGATRFLGVIISGEGHRSLVRIS